MVPSSYGFELERINPHIRAGVCESSPDGSRDRIGSTNDRNKKRKKVKAKSDVKSVIVQCDSEKERDSILQDINKMIKKLNPFANAPTPYVKKCKCATKYATPDT